MDAADGRPWPVQARTQSQRWALSRIDRADAGPTFLLELLQASERVRVDGEESQYLGTTLWQAFARDAITDWRRTLP